MSPFDPMQPEMSTSKKKKGEGRSPPRTFREALGKKKKRKEKREEAHRPGHDPTRPALPARYTSTGFEKKKKKKKKNGSRPLPSGWRNQKKKKRRREGGSYGRAAEVCLPFPGHRKKKEEGKPERLPSSAYRKRKKKGRERFHNLYHFLFFYPKKSLSP